MISQVTQYGTEQSPHNFELPLLYLMMLSDLFFGSSIFFHCSRLRKRPEVPMARERGARVLKPKNPFAADWRKEKFW